MSESMEVASKWPRRPSAPCFLDKPCEKYGNNPSWFICRRRDGGRAARGTDTHPGTGPRGDGRARDELLALVYDELRRVASGLMRHERADHTLSPTAVVHETVIRLVGDGAFDKLVDRNYLFAAAARAMREVLIDHARRRAAGRRGGGRRRVPLDAVVDYFEGQGLDLLAVHEALDRLAERDERQAQVMTLRYFGGMTVPEVAAALGVSVVTVERDWRVARAWLVGELGGGDG